MNAKYTFRMTSDEASRALPGKIIIGQNSTETTVHVLLKFLGYVFFHRERIQVETNLHMDHIPFTPDLVQLDYELIPRLWVECGECSITKLRKLAVKVPDAEIWIVKRSPAEAHSLLNMMARQDLRQNRYRIIGWDPDMFEEMRGMLTDRNELHWYRGTTDPPNVQFEFNGLWFDHEMAILAY